MILSGGLQLLTLYTMPMIYPLERLAMQLIRLRDQTIEDRCR